MAYNAWPGDFGAYEDGCGTAKDLELRPSTGSQYYSQGNNAAYGMMGDGVSPGHYIGWQRPNINASPVVSEEFFNWRHAPMAANLFVWLDDPIGDIWTGSVDYDVYTDWDLHSILSADDMIEEDGQGGYNGHKVVMLVGHHEYWSEPMLDKLHDYLEAGGNVISIGGNAIAYRSELFNTVSGSTVTGVTGVLEIKKWPTGFLMEGDWDSYSLMADPDDPPEGDEKTGVWRFVESIANKSRDYVLGTLPDMVGLREIGTPTVRAEVDQYVLWAVSEGDHKFWGPTVLSEHTWVGSDPGGRVVGHEADRFVDDAPTGSDAPDFVWGDSGTTNPTVLAYGSWLDPLADGDDLLWALELDWDEDKWSDDETDLNVAAKTGDFADLSGDVNVNQVTGPHHAPYSSHGQIVYYEYDGGGRVLTIGAIGAALGLLDTADSDKRISKMVEYALDCMINGGSNCP
ncbi:MAG: hypothetical protein DWP92_04140 [Armatimonadetes bacterium]|nr:MAG: hypothetical protein DWP92_04140 [Armatimonadota bacterium]